MSRAALVMQLQSQSLTFRAMPTADPGRPPLAVQIVDSYVALADAAEIDRVNAESRRQQALASGNATAAAQQKTMGDQAEAVHRAAQKKAIDYCLLILNDHPTFAQNDSVRFRLAQQYEASGDRKDARLVYDDLIKKHPSSPYVPRAHVAFGEFFFEEAAKEPAKLDLAAKAFTEATKFPPPANAVYGYAWYKLAYVHWNKGETSKARDAFTHVIDFGTNFPQVPGATTLAKTARTDMAALPP